MPHAVNSDAAAKIATLGHNINVSNVTDVAGNT